MKKQANKTTTEGKGIKNGLLQILVFIVIISIAVLICRLVTMEGSFSFVKTVYEGNGIYNAFFSSVDTDDLDIPIPITEAETKLPARVYDMFGDVEYSPIAVLMADDGSVIMDRDMDRVFFPASITKIMTCIVAYENIPDLSVLITLDEDIYTYCSNENAATAGFVAGEQVSALDLLYGTLLTSGADSAIGLANYVAGSEDAFADLMNAKAEEYGLTNTHFTNSTGLHNVKHYSTAHELAIIAFHALDIDLLREIMSTYSYRTATTNKRDVGLVLVSTVGKAFTKANVDMGNVLGGKTGFTNEALLCLASFAVLDVDGIPITFVLVTLGAGDGGYDTPYHVYDANLVFNSITTNEGVSDASAEQTE